jgi:hypothetical protein
MTTGPAVEQTGRMRPTDPPALQGPWDAATIERYLDDTVIPVRLATGGRSGPIVQSLWFEHVDGSLWCATQADALVVRRLERDPRCGFEVARDDPPYRGLRGTGAASVVPEAGVAVLRRLLTRYLGGTTSGLAQWLLARSESEVALRVVPRTLTSWDYSARMS